jgi:MFS transporter, DHA1 family, multidrug resistance protein
VSPRLQGSRDPGDRPARRDLGVLTGLLVLLNPLSQLGFIPVSAVLGEQLGIGLALVGVAIGVHAAASALSTLVLGPVLDLVPVRRILPFAVVLNVLVSLLLLVVPDLTVLVVGRILSGVTTSALMLCASVIVADLSQGDARGRDRGFSLLQTYNSVGAALGVSLGAVAAGLALPALYFGAVAAYGVVILALLPALGRRLPRATVRPEAAAPSAPGTAGPSIARRGPSAVLREAARTTASARTLCLLAASIAVGSVIQSGHQGVSLLLLADDPPLAQRVLLTVLIPVGVFIGSSLNRRVLRRTPADALLPRVMIALPVVVSLFAVVATWGGPLLQAVVLLALGMVTGSLMPLGPAVIVGWYPGIRGSAAAAESIAKAAGTTATPVLIGWAAERVDLTAALCGVAVIALVGAIAAQGVRWARRRADPVTLASEGGVVTE